MACHSRNWTWILLMAALCPEVAAAATPYAPDVFVRTKILTHPLPEGFSVCHGGGCRLVTQLRFDAIHWTDIKGRFEVPARSAAEERERIAEVIARFETVVGELAGTSDDRAENAMGADWHAQMDCIDESTNTTTYLRMLAIADLLKWHRVEARVTRGFFVFGWPHTTAVVSEHGSGTKWAVDSWFHANGRPPEIVPLDAWRAGWRPAKVPQTPSI
jgi:hypothetical protein